MWKTPLTSNPSSKGIYILWAIVKNWLIQECPSWKQDWLKEIKLFSISNLNISLNTSLSTIFSEIGNNVRNFSNIFCHLFYELGLYWRFFHSKRKQPLSMHWLKISCKGWQIDLPQIFIIRIIILSWPWASFGSTCCTIFSISLLEKLNENLFRLIFEKQPDIQIHIRYFNLIPIAICCLKRIHLKNLYLQSKTYIMGLKQNLYLTPFSHRRPVSPSTPLFRNINFTETIRFLIVACKCNQKQL